MALSAEITEVDEVFNLGGGNEITEVCVGWWWWWWWWWWYRNELGPLAGENLNFKVRYEEFRCPFRTDFQKLVTKGSLAVLS
jgi:hypothetical protein